MSCLPLRWVRPKCHVSLGLARYAFGRAKLVPSRVDTWGIGCLSFLLVKPEHHVVLELACLTLGVSQTLSPTWGHLTPGLPAFALG